MYDIENRNGAVVATMQSREDAMQYAQRCDAYNPSNAPHVAVPRPAPADWFMAFVGFALGITVTVIVMWGFQ